MIHQVHPLILTIRRNFSMRQRIENYLNIIKEKYDGVRIIETNLKNPNLIGIPNILHGLYEIISEVELPFGRIFTVEQALEQSKNKPFSPNWFVFGRDNYFSFWLCSYSPDTEGLSFTYWDHESGNEIEEAVWPDLESFLQDLEEEYLDN